MKYILIGFMVCLFIMCAGCISETQLTREQATIPIASLGGDDEIFTLWSDEPGCCKVIYFYYKEPDGSMSIQDVPESQSRFYFDSSVEDAHIVLMDKTNTQYASCYEGDTIKRCMWSNNLGIYQFHVPKGTLIKAYGISGNKNRNDDDNSGAIAAYSASRMISTGGQRII